MTFTNVFYGFTEIAILLLAGVLIRDIFKPIRKTFLPASVIGGVIGLILGPQYSYSRFIWAACRAIWCDHDDISSVWNRA